MNHAITLKDVLITIALIAAAGIALAWGLDRLRKSNFWR